MATEKLDKSAWQSALDRISRGLDGKRATIEVASLALGDQLEAEWVPIIGISYDPKDDLVEIALEGLDHMIRRPREIYVAEGAEGVRAVEIIDGEGARQIVKLRSPLALPPA